RYNWAFGIADENEFVRQVLMGQPEPPRYFAEMKRINRDGPALLNGFHAPSRMPDQKLKSLLASGARIVDLRHANAFAAAHIPGTISIPFNKSFTTWAGSLLPFDREFFLIADERGSALIDQAARDLAMIGLEKIGGAFGPEVLEFWEAQQGTLESAPQVTVPELSARAKAGVAILDVRSRAEWDAGHLAGAEHIPLGDLPEHLAKFAPDRPLVVHCQGGSRSAIAVSLLQAAGHRSVANLPGGYGAWSTAGLPVVTNGAAPDA
ncbi:MAG TPA: rhodanese-like domain-containing protein, partial [Gemmatimonadales bacterium]|nr:rhodanese-like domain-containing protein [Gemmatimonadales bacterium]